MKRDQYIGCSGYYYPAWKKKFYPEGLQPKGWLEYYSSVFNTVELNGTFYRTPKPADLEKYYAATPSDFRFSVKMSKQITHIRKLKETQDLIREFQDLILAGLKEKCMHFLFQLPPSFHYTDENLSLVLEAIPHLPENVIEFRHISWWNEVVLQKLSDAGITFCNVDFPGMETFFMHSTSSFYLRLHGNPVLFKSAYEVEELNRFYNGVPEDSSNSCIYFNNTYYEAGYTNAKQLQEIAAGKMS
ncbi:MAG: hypothetical protein K0S23_1568 [Fluviicola sp.]|jgi:uncharacterized protein YecE (DUF72 family)|uniref:DUF72 domain-containing protein n=1 Tax=Fluviicola sp. TaxID=1917219 RepID=UPI002634E146|nr:DUF72 domain-containing protein [Fluviicola sp.]MDF3027261.1 hypothetical protein [Fluviicola sp.]